MKRFHLLLIPLFALVLLAGCSNAETSEQTTNIMEPSTQNDTSDVWNGTLLSGKHTVLLKTSKGDITLELHADAAPKTVTNFIALAKTGYYDGLTFHRVIPDFMIQGGDPSGNGTGGESIFGATFEDEINAKTFNLHKKKLADVVEGALPVELEDATVMEYLEMQGYTFNDKVKSLPMDRGAIAMANRGPNTNGSQFFIVQREGGADWLEGKHTVFGNVTEGMDVVDAITSVEVDVRDMPVEPITFTVQVIE